MPAVPSAPVPSIPNTPYAPYQVPSGSSTALDAVNAFGQKLAETSITQSAEKDATAAQTGTDTSVATDDTDFSTPYSKAFNKTANLIYTSQKSNAIDIGLKSVYENSPNDPTAFGAAADAFKAKIMSDVPVLQQAPLLAEINAKQTAYTTNVIGNQTTLMKGQALGSSNARIQSLSNNIYQKVLQGGDTALNDPDVLSGMAEIDTLRQAQLDPTGLGGALVTPQQDLEARTVDRENIRDAEVTHAFNQNSFADKAGFLAHLTETGVDGIRPDKQQVLINRLKTDYRADEFEHRQMVSELHNDVSDFRANAYSGIPTNQADAADLQKRVNASGDPSLIHNLNNAIVVSSGMTAFNQLSGNGMAADIDASTAKLANGGGSQGDFVLLKLKQAAFQQVQTELATDPIGAAYKRGIVGASANTALDLGNQDSINTRMDAVRKTEAWSGVSSISPLRPAESRYLASQWRNMAPDQQVAHLDVYSKMNLTPGEQTALFNTLEKDNPSLPILSANLQADAQTRAINIRALDGMDLVKNNPETIDKAGTLRREIAGQVSGLIGADPGGQNTKALVPIMTGLYAKNAATSNAGFDIQTGDEQRIASDTINAYLGYKPGDVLPTINGKKFLPFEPGISNDATNTVWNSTTDDDLKGMNGGQLPTDQMGSQSHPIDAAAFKNAFPVYSGKPGQYYVATAGKDGVPFAVVGQDGQRFVWNFGAQKAASAGRTAPFVTPPFGIETP